MANDIDADYDYKIVPVTKRSTQEKITNLRGYLAANVQVAVTDKELAKAALFQEHLDLFELLVEQSRDRV